MTGPAGDLHGWAEANEPPPQLPSPADFPEGDIALEFPVYTWPAQQPLNRVHRVVHDPVHYSTDGDGRFDPPTPDCPFGTWYLSSHPRGAFIEVFGRMSTIIPEDIDSRVITRVYLPSDVLLADFTNPAVIGRFHISNELTMGNPRLTYPVTQQWAEMLQRLGFGGVYYLARHDVEVVTRSVAIFGKPASDPSDVLWESESLDAVASEMIEHYHFRIAGGQPI